jgi:hypothetical protein
VNIRKCNLCGRMIDFDKPWCDHETMEESAWIDINLRCASAIAAAAEIALEAAITEIVKDVYWDGGGI